jgi:hypothetical protein
MTSPKSRAEQPNPNLLVVLHYISKTLWLALAAFFGIIGYKLYALGVTQTGNAEAKFFGLGFGLGDAGPGLVVMVFALTCSLIGAIRSKVEFKYKDGESDITITRPPPPTPEPISIAASSARECKLFSKLLEHLANGPRAFVVLNSQRQIDLESLGWSALPHDIQQRAVSEASLWMSGRTEYRWSGPVGNDWTVQRTIIQPDADSGTRWCTIGVAPRNLSYQSEISRKDSEPFVQQLDK